MLFTVDTIKTEDLNSINNFFSNIDNEFDAVVTIQEDSIEDSPVSKYISSLVSG